MPLKYLFILPLLLVVFSSQVNASGTVNFTTKMPPEFEFCGKKVGRGTPEYDALFNWFNNNTMGWYESDLPYELGLTYMAQTMRVNLTDNKVIVSYAGATSVGQLVRAAKTSGFSRLCNK